ncbi:MAG: glyA2 [Gammaproteobacteria bacterium]|jgi:glycine hydroxymethyltransferase|nr:glyA2 [Gammaproteobacteria bacterium]
MTDPLKSQDPEIYQALQLETKRQQEHLELIASENYVSPAVLEAQGSILTNKYAEGYPHKRYYGGCEFVDIIENLAIERAKKLFNAAYANVQPHSGSQANFGVYTALLKPGDTVLGMDLSAGGHLTHGSKVNLSGKLYHFISYGLNPANERIDYEEIRAKALEHKPKLILAGFSAYSRVIDWQKFREIADEVGAYFMVDMAHIAGLVATGEYPSPLPYADVVTTTTHKTLRGPRGGLILAKENPELTKKFNSAIFPGSQGGPLMHVIAAKAVCFKEALEPNFKAYQTQIVKNSKAMAEVLLARGFEIVSGGTDNHLILIKLTGKNITGAEAEKVLGEANITVNKNAIPNDPQPATITSGIRIGTAAITTRGLKEKECEQIAHWLCDVLESPKDQEKIHTIKRDVVELLKKFPVP